jgi:ribosomal-protein-alanine N-acetyltransferase
VAYCSFRTVADEMEVLGLAVTPGCRRQGLGRWLLRLALSRGRREGARRAFLEVRPSNGPAIALYDGMGFRGAGRRRGYYKDPVEDALVLSRSLS